MLAGSLAPRYHQIARLVPAFWKLDNPYSAASPLRGLHPSTPVAENVTGLVVEGSDKGRTEYTRLTIDPHSATPFTFVRVPLQ